MRRVSALARCAHQVSRNLSTRRPAGVFFAARPQLSHSNAVPPLPLFARRCLSSSGEGYDEEPVVYLAEDELQFQYHKNIVWHLEGDDYYKALEVYDQMQHDCLKALPETRVEMIDYSPTISDALDILGDMNRHGDRPSVLVYNGILQRCAHHKLQYTAMRLLREMEKFGIEPDIETYCCIIRTIGRARRNNHKVAYDFALEVVRDKFEYMPERINIELLKACKLKTALPLAQQIMSEILGSGAIPSAGVFNAAMGVASRADAIEYSLALLEKMEEMGVKRTTSSYCLLITSIRDNYYDDEALMRRGIELFRTMLEAGMAPLLEACEAVQAFAIDLDDEETAALAQESADIVRSLLAENYEGGGY